MSRGPVIAESGASTAEEGITLRSVQLQLSLRTKKQELLPNPTRRVAA